jgi:hypothetical protein
MIGKTFALAFGFALVGSVAWGQSPGSWRWQDGQWVWKESNCAQDIARYCPGVVAGGGRQQNCLAAYAAHLAPACRGNLVRRGVISATAPTYAIPQPPQASQQSTTVIVQAPAESRAKPKPAPKAATSAAKAASSPGANLTANATAAPVHPSPVTAAQGPGASATGAPAVAPAQSSVSAGSVAGSVAATTVAPVAVADNTTTVNITVNQQLENLPPTERREEWVPWMSRYPVSQQQFCAVMQHFTADLAQARRNRNQIRENELYRQRRHDLANLLPNGVFHDWVLRAVEVKQAVDGSAAIVVQPPCLVLLGSNSCDEDPSNFEGTIPEGSPLYREFAKLNHRDFALVSGEILAIKEPPAGSVAGYRSFPAGQHCSRTEAAKQQELFVTEIESMFRMVQPTQMSNRP